MAALYIIGCLAESWLLLARYQQNLLSSCDNQKCLQTLPSVPLGKRVRTNLLWLRTSALYQHSFCTGSIYFLFVAICHRSMREDNVFNNHGWKEMATGVFLFCNAHFNYFHIPLETQGWNSSTYFSSSGLWLLFISILA